MQKFFNVKMFSQRRRPKFRCNACRPRGKFATNSRVFWWKKKCAIAERAVFSARNTALTCGEAAPTSCEFQIRILAKEDAKFGAPRAEIVKKNCSKFVRQRCKFWQNFAHVRPLHARVFGIATVTNSMQKFCNVKMFSQRRRPKFWCVARRPRRNFATNSRVFCEKIAQS